MGVSVGLGLITYARMPRLASSAVQQPMTQTAFLKWRAIRSLEVVPSPRPKSAEVLLRRETGEHVVRRVEERRPRRDRRRPGRAHVPFLTSIPKRLRIGSSESVRLDAARC